MTRTNCCSVIVTYNRKDLLKRCIDQNLKQSAGQGILIIDNASTDGTKEYLRDQGYMDLPRIIYKRKTRNEFGAGGFHSGLKYVFSHGYQYAWLMDDDGYPLDEDTLSRLLLFVNDLDRNDVMLNSLVMGNDYHLSFSLNGIRNLSDVANTVGEKNIYEGYITPFNGTLISRDTYLKIGNIIKHFLIHGDEGEYYKRALSEDIYVGTVISSRFYHPRIKEETVFYRSTPLRFVYSPPWMEYYDTRNHMYIREKYEGRESVRAFVELLLKKIYCAPRNKEEYAKYILLGILAGKLRYFRPLKQHRSSLS